MSLLPSFLASFAAKELVVAGPLPHHHRRLVEQTKILARLQAHLVLPTLLDESLPDSEKTRRD